MFSLKEILFKDQILLGTTNIESDIKTTKTTVENIFWIDCEIYVKRKSILSQIVFKFWSSRYGNAKWATCRVINFSIRFFSLSQAGTCENLGEKSLQLCFILKTQLQLSLRNQGNNLRQPKIKKILLNDKSYGNFASCNFFCSFSIIQYRFNFIGIGEYTQ